jgi:hypothetical protein
MLNENRKVLYFIHEEIVLNDLIIFSVKNKDNDFLFNILNTDGTTPKTMSVNWRSISHIKQDLAEHITINKINMNKLSKPKSFSVSKETVEVDFKGIICECANLLKSGIMNQTIILIGYANKWHEINALDLGADNSDLESFKQFIEVMKLSLVDLGICSEEPKKDYSLKHEDFMGLEKEFPKHSYINISKLNDYEKTQGGYSGKFTLRMTLRAIDQQNLSIEGWIMAAKERKAEFLKSLNTTLSQELKEEEMKEKTLKEKFTEAGSKETVTELEITEGNQLGIPVEKIALPVTKTNDYIDTRMSQLTALGLKFDVSSGSFNGLGFFITQNSISDDSEEDWNILINKITQEKTKSKVTPAVVAEIIPATENTPISQIPVKKPVSVQVFENFTPERISELVGLKEKQLEIVKANPVVKITDKNSYEKAKKTAATLLKASTAIDGKDGVDALGVRCINAFKKMFSCETGIIAKLTRDPYDQQKTIISSWENAELLREQAEQRAKLAKIKARTDELFAVPFTFNGSVYSIGTVYCLPSQIESASDEDFKIIVENGKAIKTALDAQALVESEKDKQIERLKAQLAALGALNEVSNTEAVELPTNINAMTPQPVEKTKIMDMNAGANPVIKTPAIGPTTTQDIQQPTGYTMPPQENVLLNRLDLEHLEHIEKPAYIKCRGYYARALKDVGVMLSEIMSNPDVTIKKAPKIVELAEILKKSV